MKKLFFFFLLINSFSFSQNLEETIYVAAETFIANPSEGSLQILTQQESKFKTQVKDKAQQLALVFLQSHKGYYLDGQSKLEEAIATFEDAIKRFNRNELSTFSDFDIIESCLIPLGNLYTKTGNYTNALNTINSYIFLAKQQHNSKHQISGAINLCKLYYSIGEHSMVLKTVKEGLKLSGISPSEKNHLQNLKNSSLIALNKLTKTEKQKSLINTEQTYKLRLKEGNYSAALKAFQYYKTKKFSNKELPKRDIAQVYIEEAQVLFLNNEKDAARKSLRQALKTLTLTSNFKDIPSNDLLYQENKFIDIFDLYAELETNTDTILKYYDLSFYVSDLLKSTWTSQETKILNETNNRIRSEKCIDILYYLYNKTKDTTLLIKAFEYSENTKASTLKEMFQKKQRLDKHSKDSLLIKEFNLLKQQEHITSALIIEQFEKNRASEINKLSNQLSKVSIELKALNKPIKEKYQEALSIVSFHALQNKLQNDKAVLIEYFYGQNSIYQFIISANHIELNKIANTKDAKDPIIEFIHLFDNASIINNNISNYTSQAHQLYNLLNLKAVSNYKNIILIPDSFLCFMPFETLLNAPTNTTSFSKMPFVVKSQNFIYNSSAFFYTTEKAENANKSLLGMFPVFENTNRALTYSIDESKALKKEMNTDILIHNKASKANFIKNASNYGILHLSTHASSGISGKPANIDFYNETLYLNELYSMNLKSNLVVLSACETGIGELKKAEGPMSIARGFQYSGAKNILMSLWQINDLSTSQIMQLFYKNYNSSQSAFYANQKSKLEYLQNTSINNIKKSPYYWAAFVYYGELTPPKTNTYITHLIILSLIVFIMLFLLFKVQRPNG